MAGQNCGFKCGSGQFQSAIRNPQPAIQGRHLLAGQSEQHTRSLAVGYAESFRSTGKVGWRELDQLAKGARQRAARADTWPDPESRSGVERFRGNGGGAEE